MTDQSPTREEILEGLEKLAWIDETRRPAATRVARQAISLLRSDSQRIAELEGRLKSMASSVETAAAGAVARLPREIGSSLEGDDL